MRISQREARRLQTRVAQLERAEYERRSSFVSDWPGGVNIASLVIDPIVMAKISTARKLGHAVVVTDRNEREAMFYALPLPESK